MSEQYKPKRLRRLARVWIDHGQPVYFLTICVDGRKPLLNNASVYARFRLFAEGSEERYGWTILCHVLMPDHVHLFARSSFNSMVRLGNWVKAMKAFVGNREWKWQSGFFDHALRSDESRAQKWEYVRQNPVRAELVSKAEDWPYWGGNVI